MIDRVKHAAIYLTRSTRAQIRLLPNYSPSIFKSHIISESHLVSIKMEEIIKKVEKKVLGRIGEGFFCPKKVAFI